jgi:dihydropteroate synthase
MWQCGRFALSLQRPLVMGIVNVTPDSFSDGGTLSGPGEAIERARRMLADGAAIIDVGGESTRPGSDEVPPTEELARVLPVVRALASEPVPLSVDTRHAGVASAAVAAGASIINDVSGFRDPAMVQVAAACDAGLVVMHMLGEPKTMQEEPVYDDVIAEVASWLAEKAAMLVDAGVAPERIALDPGLGFGKTVEHNVELLRRIDDLVALGYPVVVGASRKRFIGALTGVEVPAERVAGSIAAALAGVAGGARIVRVHDVAATVEALAVWEPARG